MKARDGKRVDYEKEQYRLGLFCLIGVIIVFVFMGVLTILYQPDDTPPDISEPPIVTPTATYTPPITLSPEPTESANPYDEMIEFGYIRTDVPLDYELQIVLREVCEEYCIEYCLMLGLIQLESNFNENAVSSIGAYGLMQLNPKYFPKNLSSADNIRHGVEYFARCLETNNYDVLAALRAYNNGYDDGNRVYANTIMNYADKWREGEKYVYG